jgi:hypothetical protein
MTDKQLLIQLKSLKNVCLDCDTKKGNRDVLFSQISAQSSELSSQEKIQSENHATLYFKNFVLLISRPALAVAGVFLFIAGATIFASGFYKNSKPNNSLYIARIISEKAQLNTTFSQSERDALALKFAVNHAKDIAEVLMDPEFNTEANKGKVEKLNASLQNEISKVKTQMDQKTVVPEEAVVKSATSLTEGDSMEIYMEEGTSSEEISSSTEESIKATSSNMTVDLSDIEKLSNEGQFSEVVNKLNEVQKLIK